MASITKLSAYAERIDAIPSPTDRFEINLDRATRDWILSDLNKRCSRLMQSVSDPKTKQNKREKKHREVLIMQKAVSALTEKAKRI